jgi:hypothetical protein
MNFKIHKTNTPKDNQKVKVLQYYSTNKLKYPAYNEIIDKNFFKIEISLSVLMLRKNMAFNQLLNRINKYFLLEFICVILQEQGLWNKKFCNNGSVCNIQKIISPLNIHLIRKNKK